MGARHAGVIFLFWPENSFLPAVHSLVASLYELRLSSFELAKSRTLASVLGVLLFNHFPSFAWMLLLFLPEMKGYLRCGLWSMSDKKMKLLLMVDETVNKQISGRFMCQLHETGFISTLSL